MGLFSRSPAKYDDSEVREMLGKLRRDFMALEMEWSQAYDKLQSMMQRVSKRAEIAQKLTARHEDGEATQDVPLSGGATGRLTERQRELQQQILRRRMGG